MNHPIHIRVRLARSGSSRPGRGWVWFFAILTVLTIVAVAIQIWFNSQLQLTEEQLAGARQLWKEKGPADYNLTYTLKKTDSTESYVVKVRKGQVVEASRDGQQLEERLYHYQDMPHLFGFIEEFWRQDHPADRPGPRVFATATFDVQDGHLVHYVRSVTSKQERLEITVALQKVP